MEFSLIFNKMSIILLPKTIAFFMNEFEVKVERVGNICCFFSQKLMPQIGALLFFAIREKK